MQQHMHLHVLGVGEGRVGESGGGVAAGWGGSRPVRFPLGGEASPHPTQAPDPYRYAVARETQVGGEGGAHPKTYRDGGARTGPW